MTRFDSSGYTIEPTLPEDLAVSCHLFDEAILYQKKNNYPVWNGYDVGVLRTEQEEGRQFKVLVDGQIAAIFSICLNDPVVWGDLCRDDALYLHRIITNPAFRGQRLFERILDWTTKETLERKRRFVRMDTWADNPKLINYYMEYGFNFIRNTHIPDSDTIPAPYRNLQLALLEKIL